MQKVKNLVQTRKRAVTAGLLVLILLAGGITYALNRTSERSAFQNTAAQENVQPELNLDAPTKAEQSSGDEAKESVVEREKARNESSAQPAGSKKQVTPVITYADHINPQGGGQVEVGAYVSDVFEEGGICTLTLTKDGVTQTAQVAAVKGARSVDCPVMSIPKSSLAVGSWQATVQYSSVSSEGRSAARNVEVREEQPL